MDDGMTGKEPPMLCHDVRPLIARRADDPASLPGRVDARTIAAVDAHLESCASCREALDTQRSVSAWLRTRPADRLSPDFTARLAARLDEVSGWFGIADWRAWTLRLAPVAAALALATYLGLGAPTQAPATIDELTLATADSSAESILWESDMSADSLMETMLTGEPPASSGETGNVR
jgi:anti-sigma factor RsiW